MEFRCVRSLYENETVLANELASHLGVTRPRITSILNKLEDKAIIQRVIDEGDRRNIKISLSQKGKEFAKEMCKEYMSFHKDILKEIDKDKMEELFSNLSTFHKVLSNYMIKNQTKTGGK
jgi:MarR family transcriptional regulator for hemolysin